jgi:hypothetical protein
VFLQVRVAEDGRFELARGCPQHAFQQCWPAFTNVRHRSRRARTRAGGSLRRARELEALAFLQITLAAQEKLPWTGGFAVVA